MYLNAVTSTSSNTTSAFPTVAELHDAIKRGAPLNEIKYLINFKTLNEYHENVMAIHLALDNPRLLELLLDRGADVNATTLNEGLTPLFLATEKGQVAAVNLLLERGAEIQKKCYEEEWTALHVASSKGHLEIVQLLINAGADSNACLKNEETPLYLAAREGKTDIVRFLLSLKPVIGKKCGPAGRTALHIASFKGNLEIVQLLVEAGAEIEAYSTKGETPLFLATVEGKTDVLKFFISQKADIEKKCGPIEVTALHIASIKGDLEIVQLLLDAGADINAYSKNETTPLFLAVGKGNTNVVKFLLSKKASVEKRCGTTGATALHEASCKGHLEIVQLLLDAGVEIEAYSNNETTPLFLAAQNGKADVVKFFISKKVDLEKKCWTSGATALHAASFHGHLEIVRLLVEAGAEIEAYSKNESTPLIYAAQNGKTDVVKFLLSKKADIGKKCGPNGATALHEASCKGHLEIVQLLVEAGAEIEAYPKNEATPLFLAAQNGKADVVKFFISKNADVEKKCGQNGATALHEASFQGHLEIVRLLFEAGADVNAYSESGATPLYLATQNRKTDVVTFFISKKVDVEKKCGPIGATALHNASHLGYLEIVQLLLDAGAEIEASSKLEVTPLFLAAQKGNTDIVKLFISKKADVEKKCGPTGTTALHEASQRGYLEIVQLLVEAGAEIDAYSIKEETPLCLAALEGKTDVLKFFISRKADVQKKSGPNGATALHIASFKGYLEIVQLLIDAGAEVDAYSNNETTPLFWAVQHGKTDVVKFLLSKKPDVEKKCGPSGATALHIASQLGYLEIVQLLLDAGAEIEAYSKREATPLFLAVQHGKTDVVKFLLSRKPKPDFEKKCGPSGATALHIASQLGYLEIVQLLLDDGAEIEAYSTNETTPLFMAAQNGKTDVVKFLLSKKPDVEKKCGPSGAKALHIASYQGHLEIVQLLLDAGADISTYSKNGETPLYMAAQSGKTDVVKFFISQNADVKKKCGPNEGTALHSASYQGHLEIVRLLVDAGADINVYSKNGETPLYLAAQNGKTEVLKILLSKKPDVEKKCGPSGATALHIASQLGYLEIVQLLLDAGAEIDAYSKMELTPLYLASQKGKTDIVKFLLSKKADVEKKCWSKEMTALHAASYQGHLEIVRLLAGAGADINADSINETTPFFLAAENGKTEVVKFFISQKPDFEKKCGPNGMTALHAASYQGHLEIVQLLSEAGAEIDAYSKMELTPLYSASQKGNTDIVKFLLSKKADFGKKCTPIKATALHIASQFGHLEIVQLLLDAGSDINAYSNIEITPLYLAAQEGKIDVVKFLLSRKPKPDVEKKCGLLGSTALHTASQFGHLEIVQLLLDAGAEIDAYSNIEITPLYLAAQEGKIDVVKFFISQNADVKKKCAQGMTALHIASCQGHSEIVQLLLDAGAEIDAYSSIEITPLFLAAQNGRLDVVKFLLSRKVDVEKKCGPNGLTALHGASISGHLVIAQLLVNAKANPNALTIQNKTPLLLAIEEKKEAVALYLLESKADINLFDNENSSPLSSAAAVGQVNIVKALFQYGALPNQKSGPIESTPLHECKDFETFKELLSHGADIHARDKNGLLALWPPLTCNMEILRYCLDTGLFSIHKDGCQTDQTILHGACNSGYFEIIQTLVQGGADFHARNKDDKTALYVLLENIKKYLKIPRKKKVKERAEQQVSLSFKFLLALEIEALKKCHQDFMTLKDKKGSVFGLFRSLGILSDCADLLNKRNASRLILFKQMFRKELASFLFADSTPFIWKIVKHMPYDSFTKEELKIFKGDLEKLKLLLSDVYKPDTSLLYQKQNIIPILKRVSAIQRTQALDSLRDNETLKAKEKEFDDPDILILLSELGLGSRSSPEQSYQEFLGFEMEESQKIKDLGADLHKNGVDYILRLFRKASLSFLFADSAPFIWKIAKNMPYDSLTKEELTLFKDDLEKLKLLLSQVYKPDYCLLFLKQNVTPILKRVSEAIQRLRTLNALRDNETLEAKEKEFDDQDLFILLSELGLGSRSDKEGYEFSPEQSYQFLGFKMEELQKIGDSGADLRKNGIDYTLRFLADLIKIEKNSKEKDLLWEKVSLKLEVMRTSGPEDKGVLNRLDALLEKIKKRTNEKALLNELLDVHKEFSFSLLCELLNKLEKNVSVIENLLPNSGF